MTSPTPPRYPVVMVETSPEESDAMVGRLTLLGADGIEERDATTLVKGGAEGVTLLASFASEDDARAAVDALGPCARLDTLVGDDWRDAWKAHWGPTRLGARIVVVPSWVEHTPAPGDLVMRLDPGRAFGTGQHASTALAAAALERRLGARVPPRVLDVGCGSGILAFAAVLLGAPRVDACDTDPEAIDAARENGLALGLLDRVGLAVGGEDVLAGTAELVVANIEAAVLGPLAPRLAARVAPGGALILSGVLEPQRDELVRLYVREGLALDRCDAREGWVAPELVRPS